MTASAGSRRHWITLATPGAPEPDGDGGYTQPMIPLSPDGMYARITTPTGSETERARYGSTISEATHLVSMPYHAEVNTQTVITFQGRTLLVTGVANPDARNLEAVAVCKEVVQ